MICNVKDLREFLKDFPDEAYVGTYFWFGKPSTVIITENNTGYNISRIDCPNISLSSTKDMLEQLKDKSS